MSIDKVVIQGAEFTRIADRYLLQSEVERAFEHAADSSEPQVERLTELLEDMIHLTDLVTVEMAQHAASRASRRGFHISGGPDASRQILVEVRQVLSAQIAAIDRHLSQDGN